MMARTPLGPRYGCHRRLAATAAAALLIMVLAGCEKRAAIDQYPRGALQVRYVPANDLTDCLLASTVMCANYVAGSDRLQPSTMRQALESGGLDPSRISDMQTWLAGREFKLLALKNGELSDKPSVGLQWWVAQRGYPVICVINKFAGKADYNHAVVVIGFGEDEDDGQTVHYLDPASPSRVVTKDRRLFEHYWTNADRVMLPLIEESGAVRTSREGGM